MYDIYRYIYMNELAEVQVCLCGKIYAWVNGVNMVRATQ